MKAPLVALAFACAAVAGPDPASADPIRASAGSTACALDVRASSDWHPDQPWASPIVTIDHSARLEDDATFRNYTGLGNSAHFANTGSIQVWSDDRTRIEQWIDFDGFGLILHKHITIALRKHFGKGHIKHGDGTLRLPQAAQDPGSHAPEPESVVLIATGLAAAFVFRRQLFA